DGVPPARQFQRKYSGFRAVGGATRLVGNRAEMALRSRAIRGSVGRAVRGTALFPLKENLRCFRALLPRSPPCRGCASLTCVPSLPKSAAKRRPRTTKS